MSPSMLSRPPATLGEPGSGAHPPRRALRGCVAVLAAMGVMALPVALASPAQAAAYVPCGNVSALNAAIVQGNAVSSAFTIALAPGCTYTLDSAFGGNTGLTPVTGNIKVAGSRSTIARSSSAATNFRVMEVGTGASLSLTGVTLANGHLPGELGGGVLNNGTLTLNSSTVRDSFGTYGGGIASIGPLLTLNSSAVRNNSAGFGGGVLLGGLGSKLVANSGTVRDNSASNYAGGVGTGGPDQEIVLRSVTIKGNTSPGLGGGLAIGAPGNTIDAIGGSITDNTGRIGGGLAVGAPGSQVRLSGVTIARNEATSLGAGMYTTGPLRMSGGSLRDNTSAGTGGGLHYDGGDTATLVGVTVRGNSATDGGGIYTTSTVTAVGSRFSNNTPNNCAPANTVAGCNN
ncbi:hypothetical protein ACFW2T_03825 [Streptomyces sp. NPDC058892]|uniref:hypothetical protein n=1 Tax=unclassified Streptomyces TaxID=2593676 RepID=UPI0036ACC42A